MELSRRTVAALHSVSRAEPPGDIYVRSERSWLAFRLPVQNKGWLAASVSPREKHMPRHKAGIRKRQDLNLHLRTHMTLSRDAML